MYMLITNTTILGHARRSICLHLPSTDYHPLELEQGSQVAQDVDAVRTNNIRISCIFRWHIDHYSMFYHERDMYQWGAKLLFD